MMVNDHIWETSLRPVLGARAAFVAPCSWGNAHCAQTCALQC